MSNNSTNITNANGSKNQLVWLITGTSSGLGQRLVTAALGRGDCVIATARKVETVQDLWPGHKDSPRLRVLQLDVTAGVPNLEGTVNEAIGLFGRIDVLVNNAGYGAKGLIEEVGISRSALFREQYETNVFGVIDLTCALLPHMRERRSGTIVMIGSRLAWQAEFPGRALYSSSKAALHAITETLSVELAPFSIRTLLVEPGAFRTEGILASPVYGPASSDSPHTCKEYDAQRQSMNKFIGNVDKIFTGDPMKGMEILVDVVRGEGKAEGKEWPAYLVMGPGSRETIETKCAKIMNIMEEWRDVTSNVVFDKV